jgi:hypothetical protein
MRSELGCRISVSADRPIWRPDFFQNKLDLITSNNVGTPRGNRIIKPEVVIDEVPHPIGVGFENLLNFAQHASRGIEALVIRVRKRRELRSPFE